MNRIKVLAVAAAVTAATVTMGTSHASGKDTGEYSVSDAVASQSMVVGSSPTSLGNSPLAQTAAGRAATVPDTSGDYTTSDALVQYETPAGVVIGTKHYGPKSMGKVLPAFRKTAGRGAHSGGSSSASGCVRVTVTQTRKGAFGEVLWKFHIWTDWCWTRSNQVVDVNGKNWYTSDFDSTFIWQGLVNTQVYYYDFSANDGHPKSAYYHYRMGQIENCVLHYGCIGTVYPANYLRSYYNGTWLWDTSL